MKTFSVIFGIVFSILVSTSTDSRSEDYQDAENTYFDHRVNFFDIKQIEKNFLCSTALQKKIPMWETSGIYKPYIEEAKIRGLSEIKCAQLLNNTLEGISHQLNIKQE